MSSMMCGMLLGAGVVAKKTYIDDVFSAYVYKGSGSARSINNGIDLSGKGGLVWTKIRDTAYSHMLNDTVRTNGRTHRISSDADLAETNYGATGITAWNSNGYSLGTDAIGMINDSSKDYASWSFRKAKGFFTIATWTGNSSYDQTISHDLGCEPGCIMYKSVSASGSWYVYHRGATKDKFLSLNSTGAAVSFSDTLTVTSTQFVAPGELGANTNGETYVAYLFAGGESDAATARSVDFDGTGDRLTLAASNDFAFGTGDFTIECWAKPDSLGRGVFQISSSSGGLSSTLNCGVATGTDNQWRQISSGGSQHACGRVEVGQWYHIASVRSSGVTKLYINGIEVDSRTDTANYGYDNLVVGGYYSTSYLFDGHISNFRVVKGTAVYTSAFRPPTEPLTNITNTKLLCCQNSTTTGSTVIPSGSSITANGDPTASTDSPFDDPAGFVFGDSGTENVIKNGSFKVDSGSADVHVGFEPQWVLVKNITDTGAWFIFDAMRGIVSGGNDPYLRPDSSNAEGSTTNFIDVTPTGFKISNLGGTQTFIFTAIRRSDGYCGKPPELGTGVFAMDAGAGNNTEPNFDSTFPVDFALTKRTSSSGDWLAGARLISEKYLKPNQTNAEATDNDFLFDYSAGWHDGTGVLGNTFQSWMWKRHAGFDVVTYTGNGSSTGDTNKIPHGLNQVPEMAWIKNRGSTQDWGVYHKDMHSSIPQKYYMKLNTTDARAYEDQTFDSPTATHFNLRHNALVNGNNSNFIMLLFSSVSGISKVGYYDGSNSSQTITTGFQPRFVIIKKTTDNNDWYVLDTTRGWGSGVDPNLRLNDTVAQNSDDDFGAPTSNGFTLTGNMGQVNVSGDSFIYYAHA